eukprot:11964-Heterococcus_DN1.PRE.1
MSAVCSVLVSVKLTVALVTRPATVYCSVTVGSSSVAGTMKLPLTGTACTSGSALLSSIVIAVSCSVVFTTGKVPVSPS